ncbi:MAG: RICIN domain-containing protein [Pseudomonadota bacterium]
MQATLLGAQTPVGRIVGGGPVTNVGSNLCLDVVRASAEDGLNVQLGQCRNGTAAWDLIDLGGGEYALLNRATKRVLDVAGGAFNDGANVQQYAWNNSGAQRWRLESTANSAFKIVNQRSGKCLDVSERGTTPGANIHQWQCHGRENQQWRLSRSSVPTNPNAISIIGERPTGPTRPPQGDKPYNMGERPITVVDGRLSGRALYSGMIVSRATAKCIDVEGARRDDGVNIRQWTCNGTNAQLWDFLDLGRGEVVIVARASHKVMDVVGANVQNGANIAQYPWNTGNHQRWRLEPAGRGFFKIVSVASGKCVDVDETDGGKNDGANVQQWECHGHENQQWRIEISGAGAGWTNYTSQHNYTQPNSHYSDLPPAYMVGTWEGFNPVYQSTIRLSIYADGAALAVIDGNQHVNGYIRADRLYLGTERYDIQQERRGFRTAQIGQPNNVVSYTRVR